MTGEMVVTSTGQMTCFIWMFSTADSQADKSRHTRGMSTVPARSTAILSSVSHNRIKVVNGTLAIENPNMCIFYIFNNGIIAVPMVSKRSFSKKITFYWKE